MLLGLPGDLVQRQREYHRQRIEEGNAETYGDAYAEDDPVGQ
jgi:hypothetical protein